MSDCDDEFPNYIPSRTSPFNSQYKIRTETNMDMLLKCFALYKDVIKTAFNLDERFLKKVLNIEFSSCCDDKDFRAKIEFDSAVVRCAYLLRYSVVNSMAVYHHFKHTDLLNQVERMDTVRICCLGGGTGTEVVGIFLAISDYLSKCKKKKSGLKLYFTIVDICKGFEDWVIPLVKKLRKCWKDNIDVRLRFIKANLTKSWPKDVHSAIQKCDILTMVRLVSSLVATKENRANEKDLKVLAGVVRRMKMNSWLFFMDEAGGGYYRRAQNRLRRCQYCEQRQSILHHCYIVSEEMWEKAMGSQYSGFSLEERRMMMNRSPNLSSGIWKICVLVLKAFLTGKPSSLTRRRNSGPPNCDDDDSF